MKTEQDTYNDTEIKALHLELEKLRAHVHQSEQAVIELRRRGDIQEAQNQMLSISLLPISLKEQLHKILQLILNIPWLSVEKKGCFFLSNEIQNTLTMIAQYNLPDELFKQCATVPYGDCLCGKAAQSRQLIFKSHVDNDHEYSPEMELPHGHYILPIVSSGKTLGILNLYVKDGHCSDRLEQEFLYSSGRLLAGIIERKMLEQKLHRLSYHDDLTGLANRRHFMDYLAQTININQRVERCLAVLFLDLDYFKEVNDVYGHDYGDEVLIEVARRMENCIRQTDLLARLGGDEFIACINLLNDAKYSVSVAEKIQRVVNQPYYIKNAVITIGVSIGISIYPQHGSDAEILLKKADMALYASKEQRGSIGIYKD